MYHSPFTTLPDRSRAYLGLLAALQPATPIRCPADARKSAVCEVIAYTRTDATWSIGRLWAYSDELATQAVLAAGGPDTYATLNIRALKWAVGGNEDRARVIAGLAGFFAGYDGRWSNREGQDERNCVPVPIPEAFAAFAQIAEDFKSDDEDDD